MHNDPLQFLAEFGVVGSLLLLAAVVALAWPVFRQRLVERPARLFALLGLALVLVHSLVDLPFRCPAILFAWTAVLAGLGRMCEEEQQFKLEGRKAQ